MKRWFYLCLSFLLIITLIQPSAYAADEREAHWGGPDGKLSETKREAMLDKYEHNRKKESRYAEDLPKMAQAADTSDIDPEVVFTNPLGYAEGVPLNMNPAVTFNVPVLFSENHDVGVRVYPLDNDDDWIPGDLHILNNTMYLFPDRNWEPNTEYVVEIDEGALVNADDLDTPNVAYAFSFKTGNKTAPVVTAVAPYEFNLEAPVDTQITFTFDRPLVKGSGKFIFLDEEENEIAATLSVKGDRVTVKPKKPLAPDMLYVVALDTGAVKDRNGNPNYEYGTMFYTGSSDQGGEADLYLTVEKKKSVKLKIQGGKSPYTASSSNSSVAKATVSGTSLTIKGEATGTATVTVTDKNGKRYKIHVEVLDYTIRFK